MVFAFALAASSPPPLPSARGAVALLVLMLGGYLCLPSVQERTVKHLPTPAGGRLQVTWSIMTTHGKRIYDWMLENSQKYDGKPWRMQLVGRPVTVIVSSPEDIEHILKTKFDEYVKGPYTSQLLYDVLGNGIFAADGQLWAHQRKTASHLFSLQMMRDIMEQAVKSYCSLLCGRLRAAALATPRKPIEMKRLLDLFTMDVFTKIGFGVDVGGMRGQGDQAFLDAFERTSLALLYRFQQPMWLWKMKKYWNLGAIERQMKQDLAVINNTVHGIIAKSMDDRQNGTLQRRDLVGLFLDKSSEDGGKQQDQEVDPVLIRDMAVNFIAAGRDTTSQSMSWFLVMMNRYPDVLARIREELDAKLPQTGQDGIPSMEDVQELVYLEAAIRESLRLYPVVAISTRTAACDTTLHDGTPIAKGTRVSYSSYSMARLTSVWGEDATCFNPDRWIDTTTGKLVQVSPFKFPVFSAGPRTCLGMKFAFMEMKITLAALLSKFELRTTQDPFAFTYRAALTMSLRGPLEMQVSLRKTS